MPEFPRPVDHAPTRREAELKTAFYAEHLCARGLQDMFCIAMVPPRKGQRGFRIMVDLVEPPETDETEGWGDADQTRLKP